MINDDKNVAVIIKMQTAPLVKLLSFEVEKYLWNLSLLMANVQMDFGRISQFYSFVSSVGRNSISI